MIAICPNPQHLKSLTLGMLSEEESDQLIAHLRDCDACQAELQSIDEKEDSLVSQLRQSADGPVADGRNSDGLNSADSNSEDPNSREPSSNASLSIDGRHAKLDSRLTAKSRFQLPVVPEAFGDEPECRVAVSRALAALDRTYQSQSSSAPVSSKSETAGLNSRLRGVPKNIGEYEIEAPLANGGMGNVYLGRHTKLGRKVAIKFIAEHRRWDQTMQDRFDSEMRTIGGLNHPNIVAAYDAREVDGLAVLVTELIDGLDVSQMVRRCGPLSTADACRIVVEICKALDYCDQKGLVHRDVKPSNIMIDRQGRVKLLDLGLARLQAAGEQGEYTSTGQAIGTADYVAPEQINDGRNVDIRTDLYGLGCTFFKLLTGHPPFAQPEFATAFAKMSAHVSASPPDILSHRDDLPAPIVRMINRMLEKDRSNRPTTAQQVINEIESFAESSDLADLVSIALKQAPERGASVEAASLNPSANHLSSNQPDLTSSNPDSPPDRASASQQRFSGLGGFKWIALGLVGMFFGFWLGITITITKPDGSQATVVIPEGSVAVIDASGNVSIELVGTDQKHVIPKQSVTDLRRFADAISRPQNIVSERTAASDQADEESRSTFVINSSHPLFDRLEVNDGLDVYVIAENEGQPRQAMAILKQAARVSSIEHMGDREILTIKRLY